MAAASHRRATAMSQSAAGTGSVTESKDILFGVGWHPRGNVLASIPVVGGTTPAQGRSQAFSATGGGGPGGRTAKVFYETKDGNFVRQAEYDRLKRDEEQRKRDEQRQRNVLQNLLSGVVSLDDDAKLYDDMIRYVTGKTVHLTRLLSAVCAGVSFMLLFMLFFIGAPTNDAYTAALTAAAPTVAATSNGTSTSALATPFGGRCTLDTGDCFALFAYVAMYKPVSYFFLVSSLAGCLMSLAPLVYTTAQGAPHRGVAKRYALLQRTIADPNTEPHTRRAATDALATLQMPESGLLSLVRYFFNPTFLAFVGAYACTVAVMSVEFDRQTSVLMVGITPSLYNRLKLSIIVRAGFHLLATLVSMGTASANGQ